MRQLPRDLTVRAGWLTYAERVVPADAGAAQKLETRRAFYAGAQHLLNINAAIGEPEISENTGVEILASLQKELLQFVADVLEGRS